MGMTRRKAILGGLGVAAAAGAGGGFAFRERAYPLMTAERRARILASPHYVEGEFRSVVPHARVKTGSGFWKDFFFPRKGFQVPQDPIPAVKTDLRALPAEKDLLVWFGHSSFYLQLAGRRILIDPVFSTWASPVPFVCRAFPGTQIYSASDLPDAIDVLAVSHDHWDHLDCDLSRRIEPHVKDVVTALGCGGYFESWGYPLSKIHEEDWGTEVKLAPDFSVWVLPTRHFSGRFLGRNQTQYAGLAFVTPERKVFYSGDGGWDDRFKEIGRQFGGFDLAIIENGQFSENWRSVHMMPEESAQAAEDLGAKAVVPCHNSKYCLSLHAWRDPLDLFLKASAGRPYRFLTPRIGDVLEIGNAVQDFPRWWQGLR